MKKRSMCKILAFAALPAITPNPASAQDSGGQESERRSEVIIVTARKRDEAAIDIPVAVSAFSGDDLDNRAIYDLSDFLQKAPGVGIYDEGNGSAKITIRGISTTLGGNENGYYLDDLPFSGVNVPLSPDVRAWDLERVEVLRGPQGTLFGDGSMGGTVRILTKGADLDTWEMRGSGSLSATDNGGENGGLKGALNMVIVPGVLALRVAGTHERFDGWIDDDRTGRKNVNPQTIDTFRAKARFDPTDRLSINGSYWYYKSDRPNGGSIATDDGQLPQSFLLDTGMTYRLLGLSTRYDFDGIEAFYSYSHNRTTLPQNGSYLGGQLRVDINVEIDAHEIRLSSKNDSPLQWTVGGFLRDSKRWDIFEFALFGLDNFSTTNSKGRALFGEATYSLPSIPIDLTAGLRYYHEKLDGFETNADELTTIDGDTYNSLNPRFSIAWHPRDNATIYASAAKGFRAGQLQPTIAVSLGEQFGLDFPATLQQDSIWTYELGAKAEFLGGLASAEGAVYYSKWKDVAVRAPIGTTGFNGLINSNGIKVTGVEGQLSIRPTRTLTLAAGASYADATYDGDVAGTGIVDGAPVDDVAKFTANASLDYRQPLSQDVFAHARIGWQHNSRRSFVAFPGYLPGDNIDRLDASIGLDYGDMTISLFASNLTNESGATSYRTVSFLTPAETEVTANRLRPRTIGIEASMRFGGPARR